MMNGPRDRRFRRIRASQCVRHASNVAFSSYEVDGGCIHRPPPCRFAGFRLSVLARPSCPTNPRQWTRKDAGIWPSTTCPAPSVLGRAWDAVRDRISAAPFCRSPLSTSTLAPRRRTTTNAVMGENPAVPSRSVISSGERRSADDHHRQRQPGGQRRSRPHRSAQSPGVFPPFGRTSPSRRLAGMPSCLPTRTCSSPMLARSSRTYPVRFNLGPRIYAFALRMTALFASNTVRAFVSSRHFNVAARPGDILASLGFAWIEPCP